MIMSSSELQLLLLMVWTRRKERRTSWSLILVAVPSMSLCWPLIMECLRLLLQMVTLTWEERTLIRELWSTSSSCTRRRRAKTSGIYIALIYSHRNSMLVFWMLLDLTDINLNILGRTTVLFRNSVVKWRKPRELFPPSIRPRLKLNPCLMEKISQKH